MKGISVFPFILGISMVANAITGNGRSISSGRR